MSRMRTKDIFGEAGRVNSKDISEEKITPLRIGRGETYLFANRPLMTIITIPSTFTVVAVSRVIRTLSENICDCQRKDVTAAATNRIAIKISHRETISFAHLANSFCNFCFCSSDSF